MNTTRPEGTRITEPPPVADRSAALPDLISHSDYVEALTPILATVGMTPMSIFAKPFEITHDHISFVASVPVSGVAPIEVGDNPNFAEWGWPVTVSIEVPS